MGDQVQMLPKLEELRKHRDELIALAEKYNATNIRIVGSVARGEATPSSDVDLLMTIPYGQNVFDLVGLWLDIQDLLGYDVSIIPDSTEDQKFLQIVLKDAIPL